MLLQYIAIILCGGLLEYCNSIEWEGSYNTIAINCSLSLICNIQYIAIYCSLKRILQYIWYVRGEYCDIAIYCIPRLQYIVARKSHILIYIYTAIHIAPDLKLFLSTTSHLQTHSHVHLPIYVYSSAFHTRSTTFIVPYTPR
jgi:hypothetical protein